MRGNYSFFLNISEIVAVVVWLVWKARKGKERYCYIFFESTPVF
jgi:hypothetical protein